MIERAYYTNPKHVLFLFRRPYEDCDLIIMSKYSVWNKNLFVKLEPHEFDNLVVIVPAGFNDNVSFNFSAYLGPRFYATSITLGAIIVCRKFFRFATKSPNTDIACSFVDTFGAYLGTKPTCKMYNRPERVLVMMLFIFSQTTLLWFSGSLIKSFITKKSQHNINTLAELADSKLKIIISSDVGYEMHNWITYIE